MPDKYCDYFIHDPNTHDLCVNHIEEDTGGVGCCKLPNYFLCIRDLCHINKSISHSSRNSFVHCRQAYYFSNIKGIRIKKTKASESLKLGSIWDYFIMSRLNNNIIPKVQKMEDDEQFAGHNFKKIFQDICYSYQMNEHTAAKLKAICRAFITLEIKLDKKDSELQKEFFTFHPEAITHGFIDISYPDYFVEVKFGKNPDFYHTIFNIENQVGTYFLSNTDYEYCILLATRVPQQRIKTKNMEKEPPGEFEKRVYGDILSRPSHYFPGWNGKTFGKRYYRNEFSLEEIQNDYIKINKDILKACQENSFYQSKICYPYGEPNPCSYVPICHNRVCSEELFEFVENNDDLEFKEKEIKGE